MLTRKQCKLFSIYSMYFTHKTKSIPFKLCTYKIKMASHTSHHRMWHARPMYFNVSMPNLNTKKIINGINVFSWGKFKIIWKTIKQYQVKLFQRNLNTKKFDMCDVNTCQKSCNISEVTCKMEISNIEEHNISLGLNDAPKSNCEKALPTTSKKFRNELCIFSTFKFIHRPLFSTCHH